MHAQADEVLRKALREEVARSEAAAVLVGLALHDDDQLFVERWCRRIAQESGDVRLVVTAWLCLSRVARRFGCVEAESATLVRQLAQRRDIDERIYPTLDEVVLFLAEDWDDDMADQGS